MSGIILHTVPAMHVSAMLAAAGYNFHLLLKWPELLLSDF